MLLSSLEVNTFMNIFATRPILIEVPHFASLRDKEREICILRSDNGETWHEHGLSASDDAVHEALESNFSGVFSFLAW